MLDLLLLVTMLVVCGGIGWPLAELLPPRFVARGLVAPVLGLSVLAVSVPVAYAAGVSIVAFFVAAIVLAAGLLAWRGRAAWRGVRVDRDAWMIGGVLGLATLVLLAPRWYGGDQFSVFQGNQWDTFGYLESAISYARESFASLQTLTDEQLTRAPVLALGIGQLPNRPAVHELYAVFSRVAPGEAYRLYYPFLVAGLVQLAGVTIFLLRNAFPSMKRWAWCAIALVFPLGFWGQYVFDINAWSHIAALPVLMLVFGLAVDALARPETELRVAIKRAVVLAVAVAGAAYLYPESLLIHVAAIGPVALVVVVARLIRTRRVTPIVPLFGFAGVGSVVLYGPQLAFVLMQIKFGSGEKVTWWQFFQTFFWGRDGKLSHGFAAVADLAGGFVGLYFATPARGAGMVLGSAQRIAILIVIVALVAGVVMLLANKLRVERHERVHFAMWTAVTLVALLPALRLALDENYWPAGKVVSFVMPLFVTLACIPAGFAASHRAWPIVRGAILAYIGFSLASAVARVHGAGARDGVHYAPPYPAVQAIELKRDLAWDLSSLEALTTEHVLVRVVDPWAQAYLVTFLYARGVPFAIDGKVNTYYGSGRELPALPPPWTPEAVITVENRKLVVTRH